jgi:hypothetical protein
MKTRTFKVMEAMATENGAHLRFRGQWLVEAGFHPGMTIDAICISPGVMELRVVSPNRIPSEDYTQACAALNRVLA